ncbi:hypothetical protein PTSG_00097 [Salpingoeca rosetta]|uniref:GTP-binding protein n=1 Tax=Salpingoeca rosetta (strain ATCC 50818 / BSB-021) TaxID=946362 RepID=F2TVI4_SALR5|nr:uncharacterized protein PTSG_00097 [Salpingoeca rosetta]EGD72080.1 hypothetical protein PTSG_00097 [Salpingoeca rosetta]|eukprot:XP_004998652.1 hypothetical protein PTSG_00097 [Salpingoeca rosetta]
MSSAKIDKTKHKVLLMGRSGSGKTSMRTIIFADNPNVGVRKMTPTKEAEQVHLEFMGNLYLNLWDCGGQSAFMNQYFSSQNEQIFRNVAVLIYVVDAKAISTDKKSEEEDRTWFEMCIKSLKQHSPSAKTFVLLHKMDLVSNFEQPNVVRGTVDMLQELAGDHELTCFQSSIWDESLYQAWSRICTYLLPGVEVYRESLNSLIHAIGAREVVLFESRTFLTLVRESREADPAEDQQRFERVSTILKHFKITCLKMQTSFREMQICNSEFSAFLWPFTTSTVALIIHDRPDEVEMVQANLQLARGHFAELEAQVMKVPLPGAHNFDDDDDDEYDDGENGEEGAEGNSSDDEYDDARD